MEPGGPGVLTEEEIVRRLAAQSIPADPDLHPEDAALAAAFGSLRPAAVLVPLLWAEDQWHILYTRRAETFNSHKGQVSFPGGGAEPEDDSPEATALREAFEEIGLLPEDVHLYGRLGSRPTISSFLVTPVVGRVRWPNQFTLSPGEVSRVFTIPLNWLADPANREERPRTVSTGIHVNVVYYQMYDGEILWGATARITVDLLRVLYPGNE
jgi:8-oxo-dGTP pyrophosphatase MutT (NUDIX family)